MGNVQFYGFFAILGFIYFILSHLYAHHGAQAHDPKVESHTAD